MSSIFVVIPTYNEEAVMEQTLRTVLKYPYEIVVVNDGSTDYTQDVIDRFKVHRLKHRMNLGQGAALQTGMRYALEQGADIVVHFDSDGQHRPQDIEKLIAPIEAKEADVVLGSRFLKVQDEKEVPLSRRLFLRVAVVVNAFMTGLWLSDAHNGLRALSREAALKINLKENRYSHATEIVQQIKRIKVRYQECPVRIRYTKYSRQKQQSFWNAFNIVIDIALRGIFK